MILIHTLLFASALLHPQAAASSAPTPTATALTEVLIWPRGVTPDTAKQHKQQFANHSIQMAHRDKSGMVEVHQTEADVMYIQSGNATLVFGGEGVGMHSIGPNELMGTAITGGTSRPISAGDVVHIPTGTPHQFILAPGGSISYMLVKIVDPPAAK